MDELSAVYDTQETTKTDPPLGDTTLRNPLILQVHRILNLEDEDSTGHCRLMLKECKNKALVPGSLSEALFLGKALDIPKWLIPQKILTDASNIITSGILDAVRTYAIISDIPSQELTIPPLLLQYFAASLLIINLVLKTTAPIKNNDHAFSLAINRVLKIRCGTLVCELTYRNKTRIVPRDFLLMISDCINGRLGALLFSWLADCYDVDRTTTWLRLLNLFDLGDRILIKHGQDAYKRFKLLEAVMTTELLEFSSQNMFESNFPASIKQEIHQFSDSQSCNFFTELHDMSSTPDQCADLFGLFRLWGHPILDTYKSRDRVKEIAQANKTVKLHAQRFMEISFKKHLSLGYYKKHSHWPNLDTSKLPDTSEIAKSIKTGTSINLYSSNYKDEEWLLVRGMHTFSLPLSLNLATLLADKSHSLLRSELEETIISTKRCGTASERRVILSFLKGDTPAVSTIVREFSATNINREYLVFGLREKEREVSPWARLFGLMTLPCRFYFVLTEHLLAHDIVPLFPETTVGDSAITIRKKKQQIYHLMSGDSNYLVGVINLDFEKWNLNMRYESTEPGFKFLDELYNTGHLFRNSHLVFSKSTMYLCHGVHPVFRYDGPSIRPLSGENVWDHHLGGIEGLRQKGWTLLTIATLKEIADRHHVSMQLLGQGDNQVLCVKVNLLDRSDAAIRTAVSKFNSFRNEVFRTFDDLSLPIKSEETWSSSELFAYGKDLYYRGRRLGLRFKRASRTCFLVNEGYPSLTDYIGSLASAIITLNEECNSSLIPWILYNINLRVTTYSLAQYHPLLRLGISKTSQFNLLNGRFERDYQIPTMDIKLYFTTSVEKLNRWLVAAKSAVSGIPGICPLDLLLHGFPDGLSVALTWLDFLKKIPGYTRIACTLSNPPLSSQPSPLQLCEDPTSIPLLTPPAIKNRLRSLVSQYLATPLLVQNVDFRNFLNISLNNQLSLAKALFNIEPCNPRLMADIIAATPVGQATAIVSQVSSTTTMNKLIYDYEGDSLSSRMKEMEYSLLNWIIYLLTRNIQSAEICSSCPTEQARLLRRRGWGKELIGVTVPLSVHYLKEVSPHTNPRSYIIVRAAGGARSLLEQVRGPFPEYIGSRTKEKTLKISSVATANLSPLIIRPLKLLRLIGWMIPKEGRLNELLNEVYSAATDIDASQFVHQNEQVSGSAEHRYEDSRTSHTITPAGSWLASTHNLVNLAQWLDYCKGGKNKTILFQEIIISQVKIFYERSLFAPNPYNTTTWLVESCNKCIIDTYDGFYELSTTALPPAIPTFPNNETLYLSSKTFLKILPLVIRLPTVQLPISYPRLILSYGVHLALSDERIGTALINHVDPVLVIEGYALGILAKYMTRRILTHPESPHTTINLCKIARKVALDDSSKYTALELLFQYETSSLVLFNEYGISCMPSEFPLTKTSRRNSARLAVAGTIYRWAYSLRAPPRELNLIIERRHSHYTDDLLSTLILSILTLNDLQIPTGIGQLLSKLDRSCRIDGQSRTTSLWTIISALNRHGPIKLPYDIVSSTDSSFEVLLKATPSLSTSKLLSGVSHCTKTTNQSIECTIIQKSHNSEIHLLYPSHVTINSLDSSAKHRLYKPFSHPTSAWYKWSCIVRDLSLDFARPCCLADGSGGLSRYCYDLSSKDPNLKTVFFSTLPLAPDGDEYSYECMRPPLLLGLPNVYGINELLHGVGDLTDSQTLPLLIAAIKRYNPTYITCDAEHVSSWRDSTQLITKAIITIALTIKCPVLFKSYREPHLLSRWQLTQLVQSGLSCKGYLSPYSPEGSSEYFILLTDGVGDSRVEVYLDQTTKNSHCVEIPYLRSLSNERLPLYSATLRSTPLWETVIFNLHNTSTILDVLYHIIAYTEDQLTSLKYFPDVGRPGVGKVQYISSSNLTWLVLSHVAINLIIKGKTWEETLDFQRLVLYLFSDNTRIRSSLKPQRNGIKYVIKRDLHFRNVRRRWITLLSIKSHQLH
ncbi:MAG: RNA-dependent RNA polymerase [Wenzhou bat rhabdovirus 2]|nr:MAG: RNA-dependent RNA polymerase [Wenzhou bat rhabdovirus 2]